MSQASGTMGSINARALDTLDITRSRKNGILQMVNGGLCIFFNAAIFIFMAVSGDYLSRSQCSAGGIWGGVFYITSGALIFICGKRRNLCMGISALVLNVISLILNLVHVVYMSVSVMSDKRRHFDHGWWDGEKSHRIYWINSVYVTLFSISTILAYAHFLLLIWAIFLLSDAFYWRRFNLITNSSVTGTYAALNGDPTLAKSADSSFNHALATVAIKANSVLQALIAFLSSATNVAIIAIFVWGVKSEYVTVNQTNGTAIITAPFFFVLAYFGFTSGQTGSNRRLVTFLVLSVLCGLLSFLEGGGAVVAVTESWLMKKPSIKVCTTKPDGWGYNHTTCDWVPQPNEGEFVPALITLNAIIILFALIHLALSIWGVVIASIALHKDEACFKCFKNCFCFECGGCSGCGDGCEDSCCMDGRRGAVSGTHYQPIQFVVSHQGTTTMPDGQRALVVLLPFNGNMNVKMDKEASPVTVTVNGKEGTEGAIVGVA